MCGFLKQSHIQGSHFNETRFLPVADDKKARKFSASSVTARSAITPVTNATATIANYSVPWFRFIMHHVWQERGKILKENFCLLNHSFYRGPWRGQFCFTTCDSGCRSGSITSAAPSTAAVVVSVIHCVLSSCRLCWGSDGQQFFA